MKKYTWITINEGRVTLKEAKKIAKEYLLRGINVQFTDLALGYDEKGEIFTCNVQVPVGNVLEPQQSNTPKLLVSAKD
jgi:hypothetical protein